MAIHLTLAQAAVEYTSANSLIAELTRVSRQVLRLTREHWIAVVVAVVILFVITRPFGQPYGGSRR
jgi:hypothetical protein